MSTEPTGPTEPAADHAGTTGPVEKRTRKFGGAHEETREAIGQAVTLYESWDKAEPGKGYDAKTAEWKAKLP